MARPRVFVSSTHYDLKHLRSALEAFIESLGFNPILSETGKITYIPDKNLDESCYEEVQRADIFILIVGGRYGSERSETHTNSEKKFSERYESITEEELHTAATNDIPVYALIERAVYSEYKTFLNNPNKKIKYAHVDSINIFYMIKNIQKRYPYIPIFEFDRFHEIEGWLREQWAGLFQQLLKGRSEQKQLKSLYDQIKDLSDSNETFKRYLEALMGKVPKEKSQEIIDDEEERLRKVRIDSELQKNEFVNFTLDYGGDFQNIKTILKTKRSINNVLKSVESHLESSTAKTILQQHLKLRKDSTKQFVNSARSILGLSPLDWT